MKLMKKKKSSKSLNQFIREMGKKKNNTKETNKRSISFKFKNKITKKIKPRPC